VTITTDEPSNYGYQKLYGQGDSAADHVVAFAPRGGYVLELGAGPGSITRRLTSEAGCRVTAVELREGFFPYLSPVSERVVQANLNSQEWQLAVGMGERFDAIIAADVLEHLEQPARLLSTCKQMLADGGCIIVSLPHIGHCVIHACLMDEDFAYRDWGLLDATHIRFFGLKNMQKLMADSGLSIIDVRFVNRMPEDTEYADFWHDAPSDLKSAVLKNPFAYVYQCVIVAVPFGQGVDSIDIMSHSDVCPRVTTLMRINRLLKRYLPKSLYRLCRSMYSTIARK
jgi:2-polyprenyl-3-methyl-5-hydroxy-6-metoxy-1,4-benzoquinol methylase